VRLQSIYGEKEEESTNHPSRSQTTEYFLSENALRGPGHSSRWGWRLSAQ